MRLVLLAILLAAAAGVAHAAEAPTFRMSLTVMASCRVDSALVTRSLAKPAAGGIACTLPRTPNAGVHEEMPDAVVREALDLPVARPIKVLTLVF